MGLSPTNLIVLLVIILLLFGAKRIPELAKGLGSGIREFQRGTKGEDEPHDVAQGEPRKLEARGGEEQEQR